MGTEYNGDYSFNTRNDGQENTVTFRNMTLQSGSADYLGFIGADHTVVEDCVVNGKTFYWGYATAVFTDTVFNAPQGDYALWDYSTPEMTFDGCTFNVSGKVVNVYNEGKGKDYVLNYKDCTVVSSATKKAVLNIWDTNNNYTVNFSGTNTVTGLDPDADTCSRLYMVHVFGDDEQITTSATVNMNGVTVWKDGAMVDHAYSDGEADDAYTIQKGEDGMKLKVCDYCGYEIPLVQFVYVLNNGEDDVVFDECEIGKTAPELEVNPVYEGYELAGWYADEDLTEEYDLTQELEADVTYVYAKWIEAETPAPEVEADEDIIEETTKPVKTSEVESDVTDVITADPMSTVVFMVILFAAAGIALTMVYMRRNKQ